MRNNSQKLGRQGESAARSYLEKNGFHILETNWRYKKLEVDLIACKEDQVVFVEVKTRSSNDFGNPELFVDERKQELLTEAAHHYLVHNGIEQEARFDIIAVTGAGSNQTVKHLEGAFYPGIR